ncbi:hypothetical protein ACFQ34_25345, partial [Pseudonocardia benzenivorans]
GGGREAFRPPAGARPGGRRRADDPGRPQYVDPRGTLAGPPPGAGRPVGGLGPVASGGPRDLGGSSGTGAYPAHGEDAPGARYDGPVSGGHRADARRGPGTDDGRGGTGHDGDAWYDRPRHGGAPDRDGRRYENVVGDGPGRAGPRHGGPRYDGPGYGGSRHDEAGGLGPSGYAGRPPHDRTPAGDGPSGRHARPGRHGGGHPVADTDEDRPALAFLNGDPTTMFEAAEDDRVGGRHHRPR